MTKSGRVFVFCANTASLILGTIGIGVVVAGETLPQSCFAHQSRDNIDLLAVLMVLGLPTTFWNIYRFATWIKARGLMPSRDTLRIGGFVFGILIFWILPPIMRRLLSDVC